MFGTFMVWGGPKGGDGLFFRGKVANFSSFGRMMSSVMPYPIFSHKYLDTDPPLSHQTLRPIFLCFPTPK